jgi:hypothetical protein
VDAWASLLLSPAARRQLALCLRGIPLWVPPGRRPIRLWAHPVPRLLGRNDPHTHFLAGHGPLPRATYPLVDALQPGGDGLGLDENPRVSHSGSCCALRGGSWSDYRMDCRSAVRAWYVRGGQSGIFDVRVVVHAISAN